MTLPCRHIYTPAASILMKLGNGLHSLRAGNASRKLSMKVGFIGLGTMGRGLSANLQKAGYELVVNDLKRDAAEKLISGGAAWAETPRALAEVCDIVFTSLPTPADVEAVCYGENGMAAGFREGGAWFDLSTNAVDVVRKLHASLGEK